MATQFFKRSFWYWERRLSLQNTEEVEKRGQRGGADEEGDAEEKKQPRGRGHMRLGVVVILGWMFSERRHLTSFTRLYNELGWDCLVCHSHPLNLFFPSMATTLALNILHELQKDIERHPCPVVFVTFSGGHKACLYKIIQILLGQCGEVNNSEENFKVVVKSVVGLIFDSSPVEFESSIGAKVLSQQVLTLEPGRSKAIISQGAHAVGRGLDFLFSKPLGLQRRDLWRALYSCVNIGPILVLCSEEDELAPFETIRIFSSNLLKLGGKINVIAWKDSKHVGHFRRHPDQYSNEVKKILMDAVKTYSDRCEGTDKDITCWTDLPETVIAEISQISKLPHVQVKKQSTTEHVGGACQDNPILSKDADAGFKANQNYKWRSRL